MPAPRPDQQGSAACCEQAVGCRLGRLEAWGQQRASATCRSSAWPAGGCTYVRLLAVQLQPVRPTLTTGWRVHDLCGWCLSSLLCRATGERAGQPVPSTAPDAASVGPSDVVGDLPLWRSKPILVGAGWQSLVEAASASLVVSGLAVLGYQVGLGPMLPDRRCAFLHDAYTHMPKAVPCMTSRGLPAGAGTRLRASSSPRLALSWAGGSELKQQRPGRVGQRAASQLGSRDGAGPGGPAGPGVRERTVQCGPGGHCARRARGWQRAGGCSSEPAAGA